MGKKIEVRVEAHRRIQRVGGNVKAAALIRKTARVICGNRRVLTVDFSSLGLSYNGKKTALQAVEVRIKGARR